MTPLHLRYRRESGDLPAGLFLAAAAVPEESPHFFVGDVIEPAELSRSLLTLSRVVRSDFRPVPGGLLLLDPVITTGRSALRFEGLSTCAGLYARADFEPSAFDVSVWSHGTTNVDFGPRTRGALERLGRFTEPATLSVGREELALATGTTEAVEKKVKLPDRWVRGFCEAQVLQPLLKRRLTCSGTLARRFLRSLPRKLSASRPLFIQAGPGGELRLGTRPTAGGVRVFGVERLRVLELLLDQGASLEVFETPGSEVVGFVVRGRRSRFTLLLSPRRGEALSNLGGALTELTEAARSEALIRAQLAWRSELDLDELSTATGLPKDDVTVSLAHLSAQGLVGFDLERRRYFHRELPFATERTEAIHPRVKGARRLVQGGAVRALEEPGRFEVRGDHGTYEVELGNADRCACRWYAEHGARLGPCKHALAARLWRTDNG